MAKIAAPFAQLPDRTDPNFIDIADVTNAKKGG